MADVINLKKRLVGKEDIDFDISGTDEKNDFFTSDGERKSLTKLNASHMPLTKKTRNAVSATNVDEAIFNFQEKIDNFEATDVLTEDLTITFAVDDDAENIQNKINQQKKNLNGHTLTFLFPSLIAQNLYAAFDWSDFFNGTIIIAGGNADSKIAIYDQQDITSLFRIRRCFCEVIIRYFYFVHQHSPYGVSAESSPSVIIEHCNFAGQTGADTYAVNKSASVVVLRDYELSEDVDFYPPEMNSAGKHIGEVFSHSSARPPEGAYLLNGQTIYYAKTFYSAFWEWIDTESAAGNIRILTATEYEEEIAQYGICNAFVISGNDVRLPLWKGYQTPLGNSVPVVGNGKSLGLTDGEENNGITVISSSVVPRPDAYGVNVGTATTTAATTFTAKLALGITTDADNSGLIADTSGYKQDGFYWCIQVFNAATGLSTQESAQLASQMQMKAQTDLANVTANLDFIVESYNDNAGNWYRKYRSGWIEQGGFCPNGAAPIVTLLQAFSNTNYTLVVGGYVNNSVDTGGSSRGDFASNKTTTTFRVSQITGWNTNWYACGF